MMLFVPSAVNFRQEFFELVGAVVCINKSVYELLLYVCFVGAVADKEAGHRVEFVFIFKSIKHYEGVSMCIL
jgi:hypothetical protein